jgi:ZIP family zinc transporter
MIAASVWSLLLPSISIAEENGNISWIPASVGFLLGIFFLLFLDLIIPHLHNNEETPEGPKSNFKKSTMLILAVTLHNIPEGMAVGVVYASVVAGTQQISLAALISLAVGIAIQNAPEGAVISTPLRTAGMSRRKSFLYGSLSGIVEPIASVITILLTSLVLPILPYLLSFAAGAMVYVVVEELIPDLHEGKHSNLGVISFAIGFILMLILDIALG